ncbi:helix-turn-helix domain-containing protein [Fodinicola acaciae]|uniref:helix-turn-helix domain-containing protein n=1 Tax=Fodinicola acaciae TaxID=2681555 RepID=UPI0013D6CE5F|nr:helix-turn-helix transcriptional regulator [Fodinicola acaciae]
MPVAKAKTVKRRRLAAEMRQHREAAGITAEAVAEKLECHPSRISRIEAGSVNVTSRDVRDYLEFCGVEGAELEALVDLAKQAKKKGWWQGYQDVLAGSYVGLESEASKIRTYEVQLVPGLLQTEAYVRAMTRAIKPIATDEEIERRIEVRLRRQELLTQSAPPKYWVILDESILHRAVGGPDVMRAQLIRLTEVAQLPNVDIQVLAFDAQAHAGLDGPFTILDFADPKDAPLVYIEAMGGSALYLEEADEIEAYSTVFDHVRAAALAPDESLERLKTAARRL